MTDDYGAEDKGKGRIKEAVGTLKEKAGRALGDRDLEARGTHAGARRCVEPRDDRSDRSRRAYRAGSRNSFSPYLG